MSLFAAMILEDLHVNARGVILAEPRGELDFTVHSVIVFDETTDESNDNDWRSLGLRGLGGGRR